MVLLFLRRMRCPPRYATWACWLPVFNYKNICGECDIFEREWNGQLRICNSWLSIYWIGPGSQNWLIGAAQSDWFLLIKHTKQAFWKKDRRWKQWKTRRFFLVYEYPKWFFVWRWVSGFLSVCPTDGWLTHLHRCQGDQMRFWKKWPKVWPKPFFVKTNMYIHIFLIF
jgi:hypothetical protein